MWTNENRARYDRSRLRHPSDLTDAEWGHVVPLIPPAKRGGNQRHVDVREVVNGLMYILSTGCQWRAIPKDLPPTLGCPTEAGQGGPCSLLVQVFYRQRWRDFGPTTPDAAEKPTPDAAEKPGPPSPHFSAASAPDGDAIGSNPKPSAKGNSPISELNPPNTRSIDHA